MSQAASKEDFGLKIPPRDHFKAALDVKKKVSGQVYLCLCVKNNRSALFFSFFPFPRHPSCPGISDLAFVGVCGKPTYALCAFKT